MGVDVAGIIFSVVNAVWTGGLFLPILAHIAADATIYLLLTNAV